ncbi:MAG TPA: hypothetical protein VJT31_37455 [Rugosimonospora sp.]|nr:hypothetical protein [Rugosimonospora sp.]
MDMLDWAGMLLVVCTGGLVLWSVWTAATDRPAPAPDGAAPTEDLEEVGP